MTAGRGEQRRSWGSNLALLPHGRINNILTGFHTMLMNFYEHIVSSDHWALLFLKVMSAVITATWGQFTSGWPRI